MGRPDEGRGRLASAEETAVAVSRAQRALFELRARGVAEQRHAEELLVIERASVYGRDRSTDERAIEHVDS